MPDHRYRHADGGWLVFAREDLVLGLPPQAGADRLDSLWPVVSGGATSAVILDELTRGGISSAPDFVLIERGSSGWRVLVRGDATVEFPGSAHDSLEGRGALAWTETSVPDADTLRVAMSPAVDARDPDRPLRIGVVSAVLLEVGPEARTPALDDDSLRPHREPDPAPDGERAPASPEIDSPPPVSEETLIGRTVSSPPEPDESGLAESPEAGSGYDHLFGETVTRRVEDAAIRSGEEHADAGEPPDRTKVATNLEERRALRRAAKAASAAEPEIPALRHWLELSTGGREPLEGIVIVGRAPTASRVSGANIPRLLTMTTPNQDISRTHAKIAMEGGTVVVTDLHSSNGTFVVVPGRPPQKLRAGEPTPVVVGTVIDLGDGATLTVRDDA